MMPQQNYQQQYQPQGISEDANYVKSFGINPALYMHLTIKQILNAPHQAFSTGNVEAGMSSFIMGVNQLEAILRADDLFKGEYPEKVNLTKLPAPLSTSMQYQDAQKKFKHLLEIAFSTRPKELEGIL